MSGHPTDMKSTEPTRQANRYECRWRDDLAGSGRQVHYWVDHEPQSPHWPDSAVMRWDLRPNDWHKIWPELVDHPCAKLFAPKHPQRQGPKRFRDWVESWPTGLNWRQEMPAHLHGAITQALAEIAQGAGGGVAPTSAPPEPAAQSVDVDDLLERLCVALLDAPDGERVAIAQALSTLALAPDSGRTVETLKRLMR